MTDQMSLFDDHPVLDPFAGSADPMLRAVTDAIRHIVEGPRRPSPAELVTLIEEAVGLKGRAWINGVVTDPPFANWLTEPQRAYLHSIGASRELADTLRGVPPKRLHVQPMIDELIRKSRAYRETEAFRAMVQFMANFREYKPYNNFLVRTQNPNCTFYATGAHWKKRFGATVKEDARPLMILVPNGPVAWVYDLEQVEGATIPEEVMNFASFTGSWKSDWLSRMMENAWLRYRIKVEFQKLSSISSGFATMSRGDYGAKMRVVIHDELPAPGKFGVLCHELAHILSGHLGTDEDQWWPSRTDLDHRSFETEAEAAAFIVTRHLGLTGTSHQYVSRHLEGPNIPANVSLDTIAAVAGKLHNMATERLKERVPKALGDRMPRRRQ